jgi:hypothetical protein
VRKAGRYGAFAVFSPLSDADVSLNDSLCLVLARSIFTNRQIGSGAEARRRSNPAVVSKYKACFIRARIAEWPFDSKLWQLRVVP